VNNSTYITPIAAEDSGGLLLGLQSTNKAAYSDVNFVSDNTAMETTSVIQWYLLCKTSRVKQQTGLKRPLRLVACYVLQQSVLNIHPSLKTSVNVPLCGVFTQVLLYIDSDII
jgi:hypothetical protein